MRRAFPSRRRERAFTLLEVVLAMAILVLLMGGLFGTLRATLSTTAAIHAAQEERQGHFGIFELCRRTFPALSSRARLTWINRGTDALALPEITIRNAPDAFPVGRRDLFFGETALTSRRQDNGGVTMGIEYREIDRQTDQPLPNPQWLPLLTDLKTVEWSFFDSRTGKWQENWTDATHHPALIRLSLSFMSDAPARAETFWLPPLLSPVSAVFSAPAAGTTNAAPQPSPSP